MIYYTEASVLMLNNYPSKVFTFIENKLWPVCTHENFHLNLYFPAYNILPSYTHILGYIILNIV